MRIRKFTASVMALSIGCLPLTALAEEEKPDPQAATKARTAEIEAETELLKAQKALADTKVAALGLPKFDGKTTMKEGAGAIEASMLSGATLNKAAARISEDIKAKAKGRPILLLENSETVDLALPDVLGEDVDALRDALVFAAASDICIKPPKVAAKPRALFLDGSIPRMLTSPTTPPGASEAKASDADTGTMTWVGALLDLFKSETTVSAVTLESREKALINAIAGQEGAQWILVSEMTALPATKPGDLRTRFRAMLKIREQVALCGARLAALPENRRPTATIAELDALVKRADNFSEYVTTAGESGASPLIRASRLDKIKGMVPPPLALRVTVDDVGGTIHQQENLWTIFGASGVRISGGLILSYRLVDPFEGSVSKSGAIVCRTDLTSMKAIQGGGSAASDCTFADLR